MTRYLCVLGLAMSLLCGCLMDDQNEDREGKHAPEKGLGSSPGGPVANIGGSENCPPDMEEAGRCTSSEPIPPPPPFASDMEAFWYDEDVVYDVRGKGDPVEKDRYDAIASCMVNCSLKYDAGCETMNTYTERQACYDNCQYTQTYPTACESQYIALNTCRAWEAHPAYRCNSAGQPVAQASCLTEQLALAYCKYLNQ